MTRSLPASRRLTAIWYALMVGVAVSATLPAIAQEAAGGPIAAAEQALTNLVSQGVLGCICVILMAVIVVLWRKLERMQDAQTEMATDVTKLLTENSIVTKRQVDLLEKVLDRRKG